MLEGFSVLHMDERKKRLKQSVCLKEYHLQVELVIIGLSPAATVFFFLLLLLGFTENV